MKNKRMFVAKYLGPTDTRGTRFKITDTRHRGKTESLVGTIPLVI